MLKASANANAFGGLFVQIIIKQFNIYTNLVLH